MPLGMEVGLDPGHIVLDGDLAPPLKGAQQPPLFGPLCSGMHGRPSVHMRRAVKVVLYARMKPVNSETVQIVYLLEKDFISLRTEAATSQLVSE